MFADSKNNVNDTEFGEVHWVQWRTRVAAADIHMRSADLRFSLSHCPMMLHSQAALHPVGDRPGRLQSNCHQLLCISSICLATSGGCSHGRTGVECNWFWSSVRPGAQAHWQRLFPGFVPSDKEKTKSLQVLNLVSMGGVAQFSWLFLSSLWRSEVQCDLERCRAAGDRSCQPRWLVVCAWSPPGVLLRFQRRLLQLWSS